MQDKVVYIIIDNDVYKIEFDIDIKDIKKIKKELENYCHGMYDEASLKFYIELENVIRGNIGGEYGFGFSFDNLIFAKLYAELWESFSINKINVIPLKNYMDFIKYFDFINSEKFVKRILLFQDLSEFLKSCIIRMINKTKEVELTESKLIIKELVLDSINK